MGHLFRRSVVRFGAARVAAAVVLLAGLGGVVAFAAATPSSGTLHQPASETPGAKQTLTFTGGPMVGGGGDKSALPGCLAGGGIPGVCDVYALTVALPADYWLTRAGDVTVRLTWTAPVGDPSDDDLDLYLADAKGSVVASSTDTNSAKLGGTGKALEVATAPYLSGGAYRVVVFNSASPTAPSYQATITLSLGQRPPPPPPTPVVFTTHTPSPDQIVTTKTGKTRRLGADAGEPSIGCNPASGQVMYQAGLETLRVTFDDTTQPPASSWQLVGPQLTSTTSLDPILWVDQGSGRTFVSQLAGACSLMAFSDDDGDTWYQNPIGCGVAAGPDHQTVGGGAYAVNQSLDPNGYPNSVYYCSQAIAGATCSRSDTGGKAFNPSLPVYNATQCGGLHGHVRVAPDGTVYLPNKSCGGSQALLVSTDDGVTWALRPVPGSGTSASDPWVAVGSAGTVYFGYESHGRVYVVTSQDQGRTFSTPVDVAGAVAVANAVFPSVVAGDDDRAAIAFLGTQTPGDFQGATFPGVWHLYVAFTYDGGATFTTYDATPGDPVQRGCVWLQGGSNPCRNLLDFMGIDTDDRGRVLVGYADGCIDACVADPTKNTHSALASIARQSALRPLLSQFDPP